MLLGSARRLLHRARRAPVGAAAVAGAVGAAAYVVLYPLLQATYPPITDLPFHAAATSIVHHYHDPAWHFREQFDFQWMKVPYWTQYFLGALLALVLPIGWAVKIAAALVLGLVPAGLAVLFHGMKKSPLGGLYALPLVWNSLTHWGFVNFMGAVGLYAMAVGLAMLVVDRPTRKRQIALAAVLVAVLGTHVFRYPFAAAAVLGVAVLLYPATRRLRPVIAPLLPSLALFGVWWLVRDRAVTAEGLGRPALHWERLGEIRGLLFSGFVDPEEQRLADRAGWVLGAVAAVAAAGFVVEGRWRRRTARDWLWKAGTMIAVVASAAGFLAAFLVLPMSLGAWWYVYPREIVPAVFVALAIVPDLPRRHVALRVPFAAAVAWAAGTQALLVARHYAQFEAATEDFRRIVREIPRAPRLGYMVFEHGGSMRSVTPFIHLPAWVQAEKGGWLSFHFVGWNAAPIRYRPAGPDVPPPTPDRFEWTPEAFDVSTRGRFFDWFLVRASSSPDPIFAADPSIRPAAKNGTWWLYRRDGPRP